MNLYFILLTLSYRIDVQGSQIRNLTLGNFSYGYTWEFKYGKKKLVGRICKELLDGCFSDVEPYSSRFSKKHTWHRKEEFSPNWLHS